MAQKIRPADGPQGVKRSHLYFTIRHRLKSAPCADFSAGAKIQLKKVEAQIEFYHLPPEP